MATTRVPAVEGWFEDGEQPHLIGSRCTSCGTKLFPRRTLAACPDPSCTGTEFEDAALSRTGKVWSFTDNRYAPPPPYVAPDPFEPYVIAAVELDEEKIVVMGQVVAGVGVESLSVGQPMELVVDTLFADEEAEHTVWKWRPLASAAKSGDAHG